MSCGVLSRKFLDINTLEHHFPTNVECIGFPVTLLHNHAHAPPGHYLVYRKDFSIADYLPANEAEKYHPCSWFMEKDQVWTYEFTQDPIIYDPA